MEEWAATVATALGGAPTWVALDDGAAPGAFGETGECEYTVFGFPGAFWVVDLSFTHGEDRRKLKARLLANAALRDAVQEASGTLDTRHVDTSPGAVRLHAADSPTFEPGHIVRIVKLAATVATAGAPPLFRACRNCGEVDAPLTRDHGDTERICAPCASQRTQRGEQLAALFRGGDELPPFPPPDDLTHEQLRERQTHLEARYDRSPAAYWMRILAWVALGQGALALSIVTALAGVLVLLALAWLLLQGGAFVLLLALKLLVKAKFLLLLVPFVGAAAWGLMKSTTSVFRRPPPSPLEGEWIHRGSQPRLWSWLDAIGERVGAPRVDKVIVTADPNAFATERRRRWFGYDSVVGVGVPMLEILDVRELEAVMAHELGHLHHRHVAELWVYRTAEAWIDLGRGLIRHGELTPMLRFALWYVPRFFLVANVVRRAHEIEADDRAVAVVGPEVFAHALVRSVVIGSAWDDALADGMRRRAAADGARSLEPSALVRASLAENRAALVRHRASMLRDLPHWMDSHPRMRDRLERLGVTPPTVDELGHDLAADPASALLDDWRPLKTRVLADQQARIAVFAEIADKAAGERRRRRERIDALPAGPARDTLLADVAIDDYRYPDARAHLQAALEVEPDHTDAAMALTRMLIDLGEHSAATVHAHRISDVDPSDLALQLFSVQALEDLGRVDEARDLVDRTLAREGVPEDALPFLREMRRRLEAA